jgi:hypothetical protein
LTPAKFEKIFVSVDSLTASSDFIERMSAASY